MEKARITPATAAFARKIEIVRVEEPVEEVVEEVVTNLNCSYCNKRFYNIDLDTKYCKKGHARGHAAALKRAVERKKELERVAHQNAPCKKKKFESKLVAEIFLARFTHIKARRAYVPIRAYYHKECECWHVTSKGLKKF